jgi:O-antigen/teichoic acid export membrane protein
MTIRWDFIKNAFANLGRAGAAGIVALLLPPVLIRHMTAIDYAAWVLVLQCGSYANYLDFGLQTAVGRYIAYATEKRDTEQRNSIFSTAYAALLAVAVLCVILLLTLIAALHPIFPGIPLAEIPFMRWALLILGVSMALGLPASAWNGVFIGLERYDIPALTVGGARLISAIGIVVVVLVGGGIVLMATVMALVNLLSYAAQYVAMMRIAPDIQFDSRLVRHPVAKELMSYCSGLTVMSFSMLLITGLDLILVARFQLSALIPYSVSATIAAFMSGGLLAALNVIMPHAAAMNARSDARPLGRLIITCTQVGAALLIFSGLPILIYARPLIKLWIGAQYVQAGQPLLILLLVANMIRLLGAPYAIVLISAGQQRFIKISPLIEGFVNLIASLILGSTMGAIGISLGTLIGAVAGILAHFFYSMPRTHMALQFSRWDLMRTGILAPLLAATPLIGVATLSLIGRLPSAEHWVVFLPAFGLSLMGTAVLLRRPTLTVAINNGF